MVDPNHGARPAFKRENHLLCLARTSAASKIQIIKKRADENSERKKDGRRIGNKQIDGVGLSTRVRQEQAGNDFKMKTHFAWRQRKRHWQSWWSEPGDYSRNDWWLQEEKKFCSMDTIQRQICTLQKNKEITIKHCVIDIMLQYRGSKQQTRWDINIHNETQVYF